MHSNTQIVRRLVALSALGAGLTVGNGADACGGLFCSTATPVNQAAERIVFAFDEVSQRTTAVIEILYEGPADSFAWMLPVHGTPELGISTNDLLNQLQVVTNPTYQLQRSWEGDDCPEALSAPTASPSPAFTEDTPTDTPDVQVLDAGVVGPYDYRVIGVDPDAPGDPARLALDWLVDNGYDVAATTPEVLRPYLESGMNLAAIRLTKQASTGSIRPIRITYDSERPRIPIRPTAVAANEHMGVMVWFLGSSRAVPVNYKTLELNEALIDWFNPQQTYNDVVIAAANEAADGQGFVTELARPMVDPNTGQALVDQVFSWRFWIDDFRQTADELDDAALVANLVDRFSVLGGVNSFGGPFGAAQSEGLVALDGVTDVLSAHLTLPEGVSMADLIASPSCYLTDPGPELDFYCNGLVAPDVTIDLSGFDRIAFLTAVEDLVFVPMEETAQLLASNAYVTRFYTTLSPDEMTLDPEFDLNPDLPDVDNRHQLELTYTDACPGDANGPWRAEVAGRTVIGEGTAWPLSLDEADSDMPVNLRILQLTTVGDGEVQQDNADLVAQLLEGQFGVGPSSGSDPDSSATNSGGCTLRADRAPRGGEAPTALWALMTLSVLSRARRRRSPRAS